MVVALMVAVVIDVWGRSGGCGDIVRGIGGGEGLGDGWMGAGGWRWVGAWWVGGGWGWFRRGVAAGNTI